MRQLHCSAPARLSRSIVIVLALHFILALVFAWVFEMMPDGFKRDSAVPSPIAR